MTAGSSEIVTQVPNCGIGYVVVTRNLEALKKLSLWLCLSLG